jgi:threonine/homoserine/homoserine lactone efflux protein
MAGISNSLVRHDGGAEMEDLSALLGVIAALAVGVVSPGPSFVLVARTAVSSSRSDGVAAAVGMGAGGVVFAVAALLGLQGLLLAVPSMYLVLKVLGGLYLAYLGIRIWLSAKQPLPAVGLTTGRTTKLKSLVLGFSTQVSNPKTAIVYASVFAAFMPARSHSPSILLSSRSYSLLRRVGTPLSRWLCPRSALALRTCATRPGWIESPVE